MDDAALAKYLEDQAARQVAENRSRACPRPVLRGDPLPGPAAPDMVAVVESTPEFQVCLNTPDNDSFTKFYDRFLVERDKPGGGLPERRLRYVSTAVFHEITSDMKTACIPWVARLRKATRHEDACSPYRFGVRDFHVVRQYKNSRHGLGKVLAVAASEWETGDRRETMGLMLDVLRFFQDMRRGGVTWIQAMISTDMGIFPTVSVMEWMLNQPSLVGQDLLASVSKELDLLSASQPSFSSSLRADLRHMASAWEFDENILRDEASTKTFDGMDVRQWPWPPAWGPAPVSERRRLRPLRPVIAAGDARTDLGLTRVFDDVTDAYGAACRESDTALRCRERIAAYQKRLGPMENGFAKQALKAFFAPFRGKSTGSALQEWTAKYVSHTYAISMDGFSSSWGQSSFALFALRLLVDYRLLAERTGMCPDPDALTRAAGREHLTDPCSGQEIVIRKISATRLFIEPPRVPGCETDNQERPILVAECPFAKSE
ncbi:MAG: hypothetical protein PHU25_12615 [Deltaproteobacteria bacterium]|nr:hypothetical protein [Deltaproteobacteria bacterium]